jgi:hypothetical protein
MNKAVMIVNARPGYPFQGASAALNTYFVEYLRRRNYSVRVIGVQSTYVPLNALDTLEHIKAAGPVDLAVYCDLSHWLESVNIVTAKQTVVFFHGLVGTPLVWMMRHFDALCCNSQWTIDVLRSLAGYPLWDHGQLLCPDIYQRSHRIRCPLPALSYPEGAIAGETLPDEFYERLATDSSVIGLDSFWEADDQTHCHIVVALNIVARQRGDRRLFRLVVQPGKLETLARWLQSGRSQQDWLGASLRTLELSLSDIFAPLPTARVRQADLFRLMRMCRFALMFNRVPESFGLMPLECVLNDCAVHTNGSGNIRYLLPPSHGIVIHDGDPKLESADRALEAARAIYEHSLNESTGTRSERQAECERGRHYIRTTYTADAFEQDLEEVLHRCSMSGNGSAPELCLAKGPLVRRWDSGGTDIVCDTGVVRLTQHQEERARELLGASATKLFHAAADDQALVSHLWRKGLLTWTVAA